MPPETTSSTVTPDAAVMQAATDALEKSANKDIFLSFALATFVIVYAVKQLYPIFTKSAGANNEAKGGDLGQMREAMNIVTQKDDYGRPILLGIVPMLEAFTETMKGFTGEIRHLVNHQEETNSSTRQIVAQMHDTAQQTLRIVSKLETLLKHK